MKKSIKIDSSEYDIRKSLVVIAHQKGLFGASKVTPFVNEQVKILNELEALEEQHRNWLQKVKEEQEKTDSEIKTWHRFSIMEIDY